MRIDSRRDLILFGLRMRTEAYRDAFETLGYDVAVDVTRPSSEQLSRAALCFIGLYDGVRRPWETLRLKRSLARARVPLIGVDRDAPWHLGVRVLRLKLFEWLKVLDVYATHTMQPTYDFAAMKEYLPNAVWTRNFNLQGRTLEEMRDPASYRWDVSFVGNLDGVRYREHAERQRFLAALAPRLEAQGLRVLFRHSSGMGEAEQIDVIQRSVINLSYRSSCDHRSRSGAEMSWGLPERCYGVPARGGFVLADERRHAADDFDVSREWASYRDFEDCVARIRYFAAHFPETRAIAEAAHARVMREHTYEHRAQRLLRIADAWRSALPVLS